MRRPILLDNPPRPPSSPPVRRSHFWQSRYLPVAGLVLGGIAAVVGASVVLALLMTPDVSARATDAAPSVAAVKPAATRAAANGLQYVGDVKQPDRPCEEQTWPYIAAHCLKPASGPKPAVAKVAVDRADIKLSRAGQPSLAATAAVAETPAVAAPEPAAAGPAAQPAVRPQVAQDDAQPKRSRNAARAEGRKARAEARRAYASNGFPSDRQPARVVRQTEAEYDVPGPFGTTRRVVVTHQHPLHHQAAAFSGER